MQFVYNDFKELDILANLDKLEGLNFIVNNCESSEETVDKLKRVCKKVYYCIKLYDDFNNQLDYAARVGFDYIAIDAENYSKKLQYSFSFGQNIADSLEGFNGYILMPENLQGAKYRDYDRFIKGLQPDALLMERTYDCWKPWEMLMFYNRNKWYGNVFIGIWQDRMWPVFKQIQMYYAKKISGNKIFWYSESKNLPEEG